MTEPLGREQGVFSARPLVAGRVSNLGPWLFAIAALAGATVLFVTLEDRRANVTKSPLTTPVDGEGEVIAAPAPISIPVAQTPSEALSPVSAPIAAQPQSLIQPPPPRLAYGAPAMPFPEQSAPSRPIEAPIPTLAVEPYGVNRAQQQGGAPPPANLNPERVLASRFANPSMTIPKGTVIQAVLESAVDSTRPGMVRAVISRDVRGFDGTRILIPRGCRIIGEYKSDVVSGQNRASIQWERLLRPDAVEIHLDSPSADPLGRSGVKGDVHSHVTTRVGYALFQTALNIGTQVAANELSSGAGVYVVPIPIAGGGSSITGGSTQGVGVSAPQLAPSIPQVSLTVRQGTTVSVFAARDLDFSSVDQ